MAKAKTPLQKAKDKAWKQFSRFIRLRDCLATTGDIDYGICITCGLRFHFKELQAGHFVPGRGNAVLFDEDITHAQCQKCNVWLYGNLIEYYPKMLKLYGEERVEQMKALRHESIKYSVEEYLQIAENYKNLGDMIVANQENLRPRASGKTVLNNVKS